MEPAAIRQENGFSSKPPEIRSQSAAVFVSPLSGFAGINHSGGLQVQPAPQSGGLQVQPAPGAFMYPPLPRWAYGVPFLRNLRLNISYSLTSGRSSLASP